MKLLKTLDRYLEDKGYKIIVKENQINIINYEEVIDFSTNKISLKCNDKKIHIEGRNLIISKMLDEEILITGIILNIRIN